MRTRHIRSRGWLERLDEDTYGDMYVTRSQCMLTQGDVQQGTNVCVAVQQKELLGTLTVHVVSKELSHGDLCTSCIASDIDMEDRYKYVYKCYVYQHDCSILDVHGGVVGFMR